MNFAEFYQQQYGSELDKLFQELRSDPNYYLCVNECQRAYNDCILHGDPNCRQELQACIYTCADNSDRTVLDKIQALEDNARAEYARSQNG